MGVLKQKKYSHAPSSMADGTTTTEEQFEIKALTALVGRLSLSLGWENGPERGIKTVSLNPILPDIKANSAYLDQMPLYGI